MSDGHHAITPVVSVVMPTYNGEKFLRLAVEGILNQTLADFELIVIDDASTDGTPRILAGFKDDRIRRFTNDCNLGIAGATNKGLAVARGEYVALQDHDDVSLPHRLQTQVDYLDAHPKIALVGSAATRIDERDAVLDTVVEPSDELDLKWELLFGCRFRHMTLMARREAILEIGGYHQDASFRFATDYDMLSRAAMRYGVANLTEPLVLWRRHDGATSIEHELEQNRSAESISFRNLCALSEMAASGDGSRQKRAETKELYRAYVGLRAFLLTPPRQFPTLPPEQVISGLKYLCEIRETFYRVYSFPPSAVTKHRRVLNWTWGKHAAALAIRAPWDWRSRAQVLFAGIRCLQSALLANLWSSSAKAEKQR
jgi:glycosyltransferase involved in cell wall biosynthesis